MNEIEEKFYNAYFQCLEEYMGIKTTESEKSDSKLVPGVVIGPYKVDFVFDDKFIIEIDGHEFHKTKEQRDYDYKRERYFIKEGYIVIRFMGTEVFLNAKACIEEMIEIAIVFEQNNIAMQEKWFRLGLDFKRDK